MTTKKNPTPAKKPILFQNILGRVFFENWNQHKTYFNRFIEVSMITKQNKPPSPYKYIINPPPLFRCVKNFTKRRKEIIMLLSRKLKFRNLPTFSHAGQHSRTFYFQWTFGLHTFVSQILYKMLR